MLIHSLLSLKTVCLIVSLCKSAGMTEQSIQSSFINRTTTLRDWKSAIYLFLVVKRVIFDCSFDIKMMGKLAYFITFPVLEKLENKLVGVFWD